eukprot:1103786-Prymnesium_polylepis.1
MWWGEQWREAALPSLFRGSSASETGIEFQGDEHRLACFGHRLTSGSRPVSVGVLGGSVSAGSHFSVRDHPQLYHRKAVKALQELAAARGRPKAVRLLNGALPGTGP